MSNLTWREYVKLAIRTESVPANHFDNLAHPNSNFDMAEEREISKCLNRTATRLLHAALGLCTELAELKDGETISNFVEEVGDVYWYLAIADDVLGWWDYEYPSINEPIKAIDFYLGEVQDVMKRHIFYGKEIDTHRIKVAFDCIAAHLSRELRAKKLKVPDAWEANIIKLEKRYPDKFFDSRFAIHRDTDRELDHIAHDGSILGMLTGILQLWDK